MTAVNQNDKCYFYNNWNGLDLNFTNTQVSVNGIPRAAIGHTEDRLGQQFGYSITGISPQATGTLNGGSVNLIIP
jgi:hypothetical protein